MTTTRFESHSSYRRTLPGDIAVRGITSGCQASPPLYCPDKPNAREEMAVFLTRTFALM
jgi:hypothetical protein